MKKRFMMALLGLSWLAPACGGDNSLKLAPDIRFEEAYVLALEGKIDKTEDYFTDAVLQAAKAGPDNSLPKLWAARLNDGAVKAVKVIEKEKIENRCTIKYMMVLDDGTMTDGEDTMAIENGKWKFDRLQRVR